MGSYQSREEHEDLSDGPFWWCCKCCDDKGHGMLNDLSRVPAWDQNWRPRDGITHQLCGFCKHARCGHCWDVISVDNVMSPGRQLAWVKKCGEPEHQKGWWEELFEKLGPPRH